MCSDQTRTSAAKSANVQIQQLFKLMIDNGASDLHITVGSAPGMRVSGEIIKVKLPALTSTETKRLVYQILTESQKSELEKNLELDFSIGVKGLARFRVNCFYAKGGVSAVFRQIPSQVPDFDALGLPRVILDMTNVSNGLMLVTGPTGSGKSTTLASIIDRINSTEPSHILTLEDPIEFVHQHKLSIVNQREVGADTHDFHRGLRSLLRQDPDVVLIGELRDTETIEAALEIAETGHLVFGTLHTNSTIQTISRIINVFPADKQDPIRTLLSFVLQGVVAQQLVPKKDGGRVLCQEILRLTPAIRNLIREDKLHQVYSQMQINQEETKMVTMNQSLKRALDAGQIDPDIAMSYSNNPDELGKMIGLTKKKKLIMALKKYKYEGIGNDSKKVSGEIEARDSRQAKSFLRRQGIRAKKIIEPSILDIDLGVWMVEKGLSKPFKTEDLNRFTKQFAILIDAGVPILESLEILGKQEKNASLRGSIRAIVDKVGGGKALHESISSEKGFTKLYTSLVKAGEAAGILDSVLNKLAEFMDKQEAIKKKIKKAMTYPSIVSVIGAIVTWGLMVFVVPQFVDMLKDSNQEIPWITQTVIDISNFLQEYTPIIFILLVVVFILFTNYIKTKKGKINWDRFVMSVPVFGGIVIKGTLASFTRTLSTMLSAGVPLIDSLDICIDTIDNSQITKDMKVVKNAVVKGKTITEPLGRIKYFPPLVNQMMKVGESTGNLDSMLMKVADVFEGEIDELIDQLTSLIEPFILVVLGGIIASVLLAMYLPIFMSAGGA